MTENLKAIWTTLAAKHTLDKALISELWQEIENAYTSENRYYHNLAHIQFMLDLAKRYEKQLQNPDAVAFAIFTTTWFTTLPVPIMRQKAPKLRPAGYNN